MPSSATADGSDQRPQSGSPNWTIYASDFNFANRHSNVKYRAWADQLSKPGTFIKFSYTGAGDGSDVSQDFYKIINTVEETYNRDIDGGGTQFNPTVVNQGGVGAALTVTMDRNFNDTQHSGNPTVDDFNHIQIFRERRKEGKISLSSDNPAIFELEPIEVADADIFYEASTPKNIIKVGMTCANSPGFPVNSTITAVDIANNRFTINTNVGEALAQGGGTSLIQAGSNVTIVAADDSYRFVVTTHGSDITSGSIITLATGQHILGQVQTLEYFNAYSFGNGVESDRIRDDFNANRIGKGVKVSSTLQEPFQ